MLDWLIYVESAFQLRNALDFLSSRGASSCHYIIRLNGVKKNDNEMLRVATANRIKYTTVRLPKNGLSKVFLVIYVLAIVSFYFVRARKVVIGDQRSIIYRLVKPILSGALYFVDDGAYSFSALQKVDGLKDEGATWITRFRILAEKSENIIYFPFIKNKAKFSDYALIVGAPLSECGVLSKDDHKLCIEEIVLGLKERGFSNILYFPHREERVPLINGDVSILRSENSVEDFLESRLDNFPKVVASFYSTAIFLILEKFSGVDVFYFDITDRKSFDEKRFVSVVHVYETLKTQETLCNAIESGSRLMRLQ